MKRFVASGASFALLVGGFIFAPQARALTNPIVNGNVTVKLTSIGSINISTAGEPLDMAQPLDDTANGTRLFLATHGGQIRLDKNGSPVSTPFADIKSILSSAGITLQGGSGSDERGLLGLAFHPDFDVPGTPGFGKFYTYTSESIQGTATFTHPEFAPTGTGSIGYQNVVREWTTNPTSDTLTSTTSRMLFSVNKSGSANETNHNGGGLRFGPNNYLYISLGDGGGGNDNNGGTTSLTDGHTNLTGNGQDTSVIYGKIARIDPLAPSSTPTSTDPASANGNYRIPASNPFINTAGAVKEVFLYGLRNPFRFSFDSANPNNLYIGDVGQSQREEVDLVNVANVTSSNDNYGWPYREGTLHNTSYPSAPDVGNDPIGEYTHGDGIAIDGGFVYRGNAIPQLAGKYVFGDLGSTNARLFYMDASGGTISALQFSGDSVPFTGRMDSVGEDQNGNIYALMASGNVIELVPEPTATGAASMLLLLTRRRRRLTPQG
jgi:glucose/arabinose dehydrogenase